MLTIIPLVIITLILVLACLESYIHITPSVEQQQHFSFKPTIPFMKQINAVIQPPPEPEYKMDDTCKLVDFQWLAADRIYWDGWKSKSMFMKKDGTFTRKTVTILEKESICIVVLLGPIPAVASLKPELHYAPPDSILMTAKGNSGTTTSIRLKQHQKQYNVYFAPIQFSYSDHYILEGSIESRSYFWEQPMFHHLSNKMMILTGSNELIVRRSNSDSNGMVTCIGNDDLQGIWMKKSQLQQRDPIRYYSEFKDFLDRKSDGTPVFVPNFCELRHAGQQKCLGSKIIHVWGDRQLRRNIQLLKGSMAWCDKGGKGCMCDEMKDHITVDTTLELLSDTKIYFRHIESIIHDFNDWKMEMAGISRWLPKPDMVLLGIGNDDLLKTSRQTPTEFAIAFNSLVDYLIHHVYPTETIIVRTPQFIGSESDKRTGWNAGRSEAYANVVRTVISNLSPQRKTRMILWDTHQLGGDSVSCRTTLFSNLHLVEMENELLLTFICNNPYT